MMKIQDVRINSIYQIEGIPVRVLNWYSEKKVSIQFLLDRTPDTTIVYYHKLEEVEFNEEFLEFLGFKEDGEKAIVIIVIAWLIMEWKKMWRSLWIVRKLKKIKTSKK